MSILTALVSTLTAFFSAPADAAPPSADPVVDVSDVTVGAPASPVWIATAPTAPAANLDDVVARLQKAYEGTTDFSARFTQRYTYMALKKTQESKGTVAFKKPGRMRWDYESPTKKSFVVGDGKLHVLQPEDNTALVDHCFKEDGLTASVSFLWGSGDIKGQFDVSFFPGTFGAKTDHHLLLLPKVANGVFAKLILVVDPATSRVKQSIVVDPQGNVNQFIFEDARFNAGLEDRRFAVALPKGMVMSRMPGSCDPAAKPAAGAR